MAQLVSTRRHYMHVEESNEGDQVVSKVSFDPRFLVFEFTYNLILRESQVLFISFYFEFIHKLSVSLFK